MKDNKKEKKNLGTRIVAAVLAIMLAFGGVATFGEKTEVDAASYGVVDLGYKKFSQERSSDCFITATANALAYRYGVTDGVNNRSSGGRYYNASAQACYDIVLSTNANSLSFNVARMGLTSISTTPSSIYNQLKAGNPVIIYAWGDNAHASVIFGFKGGALTKSNFRVSWNYRYGNKEKTWAEFESIHGANIACFIISDYSKYDSYMQNYCNHSWKTNDTLGANCTRCHKYFSATMDYSVQGQKTTTKSSVTLKASPYSASTSVKTIPSGAKVTKVAKVINCYGNTWFYVSYTYLTKTYTGFVYNTYLK